jgi:putative ABC transport system substrate-binding protein
VGLTISRLTLVVAVLCLAAPLAAMAQAGRVRIGYLTAGDEARNPRNAAFRQRLRELGYVEGQDVTLEIRAAAGKLDRLPGLAAELVRLKVDVIVANNSPAIDAARKATTSIPIVMSAATDPVATGFVTSLARPGGNITGLTIQSPDLSAKTLQLLKEAVPNLSRVTVLLDPGFPGGRRWLSELETAAPALVVQLQVVEVRSPSDLEGAFAAATKNRAGAVLSVAGSIGFLHRAQIADLAVKRRLPTVGGLPEYAEAGWLMGFGARFIDQDRRAADFVDRILKGAKPADLPIEQPTKFYLAINLKTAKALGLSIPPPLLLRADQLIQ